MSNILFTNFATTVLAAPLSSGATSATLLSGTGALFPSPTGAGYFLITLTDALTGDVHEIVKVTARSGDVLTIVRAQEGTTAANWLAGDTAALFLTAGSIAALQSGFPVGSSNIAAPTTLSIANSGIFYSVNATIVVTLPTASSVAGMPVGFFNNSSGTCTIGIAPAGGTFVGGSKTGATSIVVPIGDYLCVQSDGTNWNIFSVSYDLVFSGTIASQAWVGTNFDPLGAAAAALAAAESFATGAANAAQSNAETYASAQAAAAQNNAETYAAGLVSALHASLVQVTPVSNAVGADWRSAGGLVNCSVSFTAPCNGVVLAMSSINLNAPAASGSLIVGILSIRAVTASTDQTQETQAHFGSLSVASGTSVTGLISGNGSPFPVPGVQATLHITMFFLPTP